MLKKKFILLFILNIVIIIIILLLFLSVYTLELRSYSDNKLIYKKRVQIKDKFTLKYSHSVALTPVWEIFTINDSFQVVLIETNFLDHGAGLPYTAYNSEVFLNEDGKFKIKNMYRVMPSPIYYMVEKNRENYIYFKYIEINLSSLCGDELLTIGVYKTNLFNHFLGGNLYE